MALPTSGTITWEMIRQEFGGGYPIYISQYYRGGGLVPNTAANAAIPTSGTIYASQFYGASAGTALGGYLSPSTITQTVNLASVSRNITAQGTGGSGSYTYSWSLVNNTGGFSLANASSATCTVSRSGLVNNVTYNCIARCVISDGVTTVTRDCPIAITRTTPPVE